MQAHKASWWRKGEGSSVCCELCPHNCRIADGGFGICGVRKNQDGELFSLSYGYPVALHVDPIEKKPLAEFMPGTKTFSLGTFGCNLNCSFCQNYSMSRGDYEEFRDYEFFSPGKIIRLAIQYRCDSVALTYNEPTVFAEYGIDIARLAHDNGLKTVLVSNGYISPSAASVFYPHIDAANIDMKGFSEDFYASMTSARLQPVLDSIKYFYSLGKHLELTNLVIPGKNDARDMVADYLDWVERELDVKVPLHFSAYHPDYKYKSSPSTDASILINIREYAFSRGFQHVYLGNVLLP